MRAEAAKYGYALVVVDASRDNAKQQSQVEDFISKHVDAIVLTPYDSQAIGSAIVEANDANIPVFTADIANTSNQGNVVAHVASDNVQGGFEAGKLICQAVGKSGSVAIIDEPEVTSVQDRVKGFKAGARAALSGRHGRRRRRLGRNARQGQQRHGRHPAGASTISRASSGSTTTPRSARWRPSRPRA